MNTLRTPMTDGHVKAAKSEFVDELKPLVEGYKAAKAVSEQTDGDEGREALDRIVEATANAYRRAAHRQIMRGDISHAVHDVLCEALGDTYDDKKMLGMERQLYREVAEFGTGDCGAETKKEMVAQHGTELAECALSAEPEMIAFRVELNRLTPVVDAKNARNIDFWSPFANLACDMFDARTEGGRYTPTLAPIICHEMQRVSAPQYAIDGFMSHVRANEERLEALFRMHRDLKYGNGKAAGQCAEGADGQE